eukprot:jgi/Astpho2/6478/e_gw1.00096.12.1_t
MQVAYFYDADVATYYYGQHHPMKPHRIKMTHSLILNYGLYNMMECYKPLPATKDELATFHSTDYLDFLQTVTTENKAQFLGEMKRFCVGEDCPVFNDIHDHCSCTDQLAPVQKYAGGSIGGAVKLNQQANDVCINWAGGLHHAKKAEASGFCYVNDIVLAILELLKYHARVLYVDIDIHHGDGVEEAFLTTDRVMTVSFHKYDGEFFPGTGRLNQIGHDRGRGYAMNIPLNDGIDDESYEQLFKPIMRKVVEVYKPEVIVFQSGADSLAGDKLGAFNLSMRGHAAALMSMKAFGIPMMVLGGGGYRISNVARCWAFETGQILGVEMDNQLPPDPWLHNYGPDFHLHIQSRTGKENQNTPERLGRLQQHVIENLKRIQAPSVPFHDRAPDAMAVDDMHTTLPTAGDDTLPADDVESKQGRSRMDIDSNAGEGWHSQASTLADVLPAASSGSLRFTETGVRVGRGVE